VETPGGGAAIHARGHPLRARQAYLDGELCGTFPNGVTSFSMIQAASDAGNAAGLVYFIFDLLHLNGEDLAALALMPALSRDHRRSPPPEGGGTTLIRSEN